MNGIADCLSRLGYVCVISEVPSLFQNAQLLEEQKKFCDTSNAFEYLDGQRRNYDVSKLGDLKRFRKKLNVDANGLLIWKKKL